MLRGVLRVVVFGALTVAVTALVGRAFHVAV
jgi:VIT1/CCC1 family predicted Fe2+/Mn2+ transporter